MAESRLLLMILGVGSVVAAFTVLIARLSGRRRWPKYVPALLAVALTAYLLIRALGPSNGWEDLIFAVMSMLTGGVAVIALLAARAARRRQ